MKKTENGESGISMTGRELIPRGEVFPHPIFWFLAALGQLLLAAWGLSSAAVSGLSLNINFWILYPGIFTLCLAATLFFFGERLNGYRLYIMMGLILIYAVILFFTQGQFLTGAMQVGNAVLRCMNQHYQSNLDIAAVGGNSVTLTIFLLEISAFAVFCLGGAIVYRPDSLWITWLLFPVVALILLAGGSPSVLSLFLLLFSVISVLVSARSVRKKRLWGEKGDSRFKRNLICHENIQKKTALLICIAGIFLSVLGFYVVRPGLNLQLTKAERVTAKVEGKLMEAMIDILPKISAGQLNLRVETAGGGVSDGALGDTGGYALSGIEDLKLICSYKPSETIYLKGFVGGEYAGDRWLEPDGDSFDSAAANWRTEDDARLYISNLPFLRRLYIENDADTGTSQMQEITVERINANSNYTYYPYYAFLNDYYLIQNGDGYVGGQSEQDDVFSFYPRQVFREAVEIWNADEDKKSVLDRVESSYAAYVKNHYLAVPEGLEELETQCEEQKLEKDEVDKITVYIQNFLSEGFEFSLDIPELPEGEDFVRYFLYESKTGYSTHYASTAVLMFRMFGVPARYVVGYAAPQNLFTAQTDGTYTAVLQDDNSHAWAEIYITGVGWTPVETTPGALGMAEDVAYQSDTVVNKGNPVDETEEEADAEEQAKEPGVAEKLLNKWFDGNLESIIHLLTALIVTSLIAIRITFFIRKRRRDYGLNTNIPESRRIEDIFCAYYQALVKKGMLQEVESTSEEFARQVKEWNTSLPQEEFDWMLEVVLESCYGFRDRTETEVIRMREIYKMLRKDLRRNCRKN